MTGFSRLRSSMRPCPLSPQTTRPGARRLVLTNAQWPELEDFYGYLAGVHIEVGNEQLQARVYLPVKVPNARGGIDVKARAVGPTFYGRTGREVFELAERWAIDYLKGGLRRILPGAQGCGCRCSGPGTSWVCGSGARRPRSGRPAGLHADGESVGRFDGCGIVRAWASGRAVA